MLEGQRVTDMTLSGQGIVTIVPTRKQRERPRSLFTPPSPPSLARDMQESTLKVRLPASQVGLRRMQLTLHAARRTPHGALRLVHAMSAWSIKNPTRYGTGSTISPKRGTGFFSIIFESQQVKQSAHETHSREEPESGLQKKYP